MGYQGLWGWGGDLYYVIVGGLLLHLECSELPMSCHYKICTVGMCTVAKGLGKGLVWF